MPTELPTDEQLAEAARAGDTVALDTLLQRYKPLVKTKTKAYYLTSGDPEDLIQEGMIGLYKAVLGFDPVKNASFAAFASLCVSRQVQSAVKAAGRQKHLPLNNYWSLNNEVYTADSSKADENRETFLDKLPDNRPNDPEALFLDNEAKKTIDDFIKHHLSPMEHAVLMLQMDGKSHAEIAQALGKNIKSIDNTIQRIRRKVGRSIRDA